MSAAITDSGDLYMWGLNSSGQLGLNDKVDRLYPVKVNLPSDVRSIVMGTNFSVVLLEDGTVMAAGDNTYYTLGDGTQLGSNIFKKVVGLSNIEKVSCGYRNVLR